MKSILEKAGKKTRGYVSPSISADSQVPSAIGFDWKTPAALMAGAWFFKKFPKTSIVGLLAAGIYVGLTTPKEKNPFLGSGIVKDLH